MNRRYLQIKIANLKAELEDIKAELLAEDVLGVGANENAGWQYGEGYFHDGKTKDTKAEHEYNVNYYSIDENKSKFWGVKGKK